MVWNRYGLVTQFRGHDQEDDDNDDDNHHMSKGSIEVDFHDANLHHSLRLSNTVGYTMADLSLTAVLLASPVGLVLARCHKLLFSVLTTDTNALMM